MARKEKVVNPIKSIDMVSSNEKPKKGAVFTEWDIVFEDNVSPRKKDQIIEGLLKKVLRFKVKDKTVTTSLKYQKFKSETNEHLYILRVYRECKKLPVVKKSLAKSSAVGMAVSDIESGPIRTPGPPVPKLPAGVSLLSDTVGLSEDAPV